MTLVGYVDRWTAEVGQVLAFRVSSEADFSVSIIRLIHGDTNPLGPGFKSLPVCELAKSLPAKVQPIVTGSYVRFEPDTEFPDEALAISLWIWPTLFGPDEQGIISRGGDAGEGFGMVLDPEGRIVWRVGSAELVSGVVPVKRWTEIRACFDGSGAMQLQVTPQDHSPSALPTTELKGNFEGGASCAGPLLVGARKETAEYRPVGCFNGKIGGVTLSPVVGDEASSGASALTWNFGLDVGSRRAVDMSGNERHGEVVNRPTRGVTGPLWKRSIDRYLDAPEEFDAIHFHEDDLEDCRWDPSFEYEVPEELESGVYAAELRTENECRHIAFFVTPPLGKSVAPVAVLMPTVSYMAYSNEAIAPDAFTSLTPLRNPHLQKDDYAYIEANHITSLYDCHTDGSGRCMTTVLRPSLTSVNPSHRCRLFDSPHQLCADLHLIDWLHAKGISYDILTDHQLDTDGSARLKPYRVVLSGTHHEYWTENMLDGLSDYQQQGGRFVYLSGNGLYWVTALDETGSIAEIRRRGGTETWSAAPGEALISLNGKYGGLWRDRGRPPQLRVGVGMASQGFDRGSPYKRHKESYDARVAFAFAGIEEELLGDFPALVLRYGAAGYEIDRADFELGTPHHALIVATADGFSDSYQHVREETYVTAPLNGGTMDPEVRADMVYYEGPNGGAVFSVGSIAFCSTLSFNNYSNNISSLLGNIVKTFSDSGWTPPPVNIS